MRMQVILDSLFARAGSTPGRKGEFRDWSSIQCNLTRKALKLGFSFTVRATVHTNQSRKRSLHGETSFSN